MNNELISDGNNADGIALGHLFPDFVTPRGEMFPK